MNFFLFNGVVRPDAVGFPEFLELAGGGEVLDGVVRAVVALAPEWSEIPEEEKGLDCGPGRKLAPGVANPPTRALSTPSTFAERSFINRPCATTVS